MKDIIVKQHDITDCGSCCLLSIIKYYNGYVPLEIIKMDTLTDNKGTSFYNIKKAAEKYGFEVYGYQNQNIKPPYIIQTKENNYFHFIVVYKIIDNTYYCMDPAIGYIKYSKDKYEEIFTGNILKLTPVNNILTYKKNNFFIKNILSCLRKNYPLLIIILILNILSIIFSLINTYNLKIIFSNYQMIKVFIILALIKNVFVYIKNHLLAHLDKLNNIKISSHYIKHILHLPSKYLQLNQNGEIISRINDLHNIRNIYTKEIINIIIYILSFIIIEIIFYILNKMLSVIIILISLLFVLLIHYINKRGFNAYLNYIDSTSNLNDKLVELVNSLLNIKNLNIENFYYHQIEKVIKENNNKSYDLDIYLNKVNTINMIFNDISILLIIIFNYHHVEDTLIYILYYNYYLDCINYFTNLLTNLSYFKSVISRINGIYYLEEESLQNGSKIGNISINNLTYEINNNKIFNNYNLLIKEKEKTLLKGPNGVGKSTLLNILSNNITDYKGTILVGNTNIKNINIKNHLLYSNNKDVLFKDTILNNILLDKPYIKDKISLVSKIVYLDKIINKKDSKFESIVNNNLSRGEEQRILLARNLYQDKDILILDESLSDINYRLRKKIINNINNYYKDKTIIYVSHNLEKNHFDRVIKLTARKE